MSHYIDEKLKDISTVLPKLNQNQKDVIKGQLELCYLKGTIDILGKLLEY